MNKFFDELKAGKIFLCDGSMGTELQSRGFPPGFCPEELNISNPEIVQQIYKDYLYAGADIIETNTFGANRARLKLHGYENRVLEFCTAAVKLAKEACTTGKYVAGSIGPTGELIIPLGELSIQEAYDIFSEQAKALESSGADVIFIETMMAAEEAGIAIKAVKENTRLPVACTMTFEKGKSGIKTAWGVDVHAAVKTLSDAGADIVGSNCGRGFEEMIEVIKEMRPLTTKPILAQSNAGLPEWIHGESIYTQTPKKIAPIVELLLKTGVNIIGGCCGTNPGHIKKMRQILDHLTI